MTVYPHRNDTWARRKAVLTNSTIRWDPTEWFMLRQRPFLRGPHHPASQQRRGQRPSPANSGPTMERSGGSRAAKEENLRDCMLHGWTCVFAHYSKAPTAHRCAAEVTCHILRISVLQIDVSRWRLSNTVRGRTHAPRCSSLVPGQQHWSRIGMEASVGG